MQVTISSLMYSFSNAEKCNSGNVFYIGQRGENPEENQAPQLKEKYLFLSRFSPSKTPTRASHCNSRLFSSKQESVVIVGRERDFKATSPISYLNSSLMPAKSSMGQG